MQRGLGNLRSLALCIAKPTSWYAVRTSPPSLILSVVFTLDSTKNAALAMRSRCITTHLGFATVVKAGMEHIDISLVDPDGQRRFITTDDMLYPSSNVVSPGDADRRRRVPSWVWWPCWCELE